MNIKILRIFEYEKYFLALVIISLMFIIAKITGHREIIFPEIVSIVVLCLITKRQILSTNRLKMVILTVLASLIGVIIVRYFQIPIYFQIILGFLLPQVILIVSKSNFVPIIAACLFPVYMKVTSFVYPITAFILVCLIALCQYYLIKQYKLKPLNVRTNKFFNVKAKTKHLLKLFFVFALIAVLPVYFEQIFILPPPFIVALVVLSNPMSSFRKYPVKIFNSMIAVTLIGILCRLLINIYLGFPLAVSAMIACIMLFVLIEKRKIFFPPIGGTLLMPIILKKSMLLLYFPEILIGLIVIFLVTLKLFKSEEINAPD